MNRRDFLKSLTAAIALAGAGGITTKGVRGALAKGVAHERLAELERFASTTPFNLNSIMALDPLDAIIKAARDRWPELQPETLRWHITQRNTLIIPILTGAPEFLQNWGSDNISELHTLLFSQRRIPLEPVPVEQLGHVRMGYDSSMNFLAIKDYTQAEAA